LIVASIDAGTFTDNVMSISDGDTLTILSAKKAVLETFSSD
jgi:hypothetical protein